MEQLPEGEKLLPLGKQADSGCDQYSSSQNTAHVTLAGA